MQKTRIDGRNEKNKKLLKTKVRIRSTTKVEENQEKKYKKEEE